MPSGIDWSREARDDLHKIVVCCFVAIRASAGCRRMTGAEFMAVGGFVIVLFGALFGVWKYVDGKLSAVRDTAEKTQRELAAHKLHAAETFATKSGMAEQTNQLLRAIESIGNRIDAISERLDRVFEQRPARRS